MNTKSNNIIAIDIAKSTLQVQTENASFATSNDTVGYKKLAKFMDKLEVSHVVCEATGGYERPLVRNLFEQGVTLSMVSPATVRAFAKGEGILLKTDRIDAHVLLKYGQTRELWASLCVLLALRW